MSAESSPTPSVDCDRPPESRSLDLTNRLPDAIIQHILSFLPTKQAVATSVLSKRWRYLWTLVPNLEFDNSKADVHDGRFSDFVNKTLRFHRAAALDKFHLKCSPYGDFSEIESWLDVAVLRRPRELKLSLCSSEGSPFRLPGSVLNCRTIAVLKLKGEGILVDVGDSSVQLPCLKVLHLFFVHYLNDESLTGLLSGCLALEEIHFRRSYYRDNVKNLCINVPSLRRLVLVCPKTCVATRRYKLEIKAPALRYLELRAVQCQTLLVEEFPELVGATLDFCGPLTGQLFSALRNVKHLSLDNLPISLPQGGLKLFPMYPHLVHLEFTLLDSLWGVLMNLLENSPNLKALIICKDERNLHWSYPEYFPNCVTNQLETFCIRGFTCSAGEMSFMRYILEEAEALRRVNIHVFHMDSNAKLSLHEQFSAFPKSSNSCQIEII